MSRLVTFGCSHTYGYGLLDLTDGVGPSKLAWPSVLSKSLSKELVNKSYPGWSNTRILHEILNFNFEKGDLVVILWAAIDRDVIFNDTGNEYHVGSWVEDELAKKYFDIHTDLDLAIKTLRAINHADLLLTNKKINCKHFLYTNKFYQVVKLARKKCKWFDTPVHDANIRSMKIDDALDNIHFGEKTHIVLSEYIKNLL
jgi:hypothetical protein